MTRQFHTTAHGLLSVRVLPSIMVQYQHLASSSGTPHSHPFAVDALSGGPYRCYAALVEGFFFRCTHSQLSFVRHSQFILVPGISASCSAKLRRKKVASSTNTHTPPRGLLRSIVRQRMHSNCCHSNGRSAKTDIPNIALQVFFFITAPSAVH